MPQQYSFQELFVEQVNDLFSAEEQILAVLPRLISAISSGELRETLTHYLQEINQHRNHLTSILEAQSLVPKGLLCKAIEGMLEDADQVIIHGGNSAVKDAAFIAVMQRLQHYKIAVYGTSRTFARHLNESKAMDFLQQALNEEGEADKKLTKLAEGGLFTTGINEEAIKEAALSSAS